MPASKGKTRKNGDLLENMRSWMVGCCCCLVYPVAYLDENCVIQSTNVLTVAAAEISGLRLMPVSEICKTFTGMFLSGNNYLQLAMC